VGTLYETIEERTAETTTMKKLYFLLIPIITFSQVKLPNVPQPTQFQPYGNQNFGNPNIVQPSKPMDIISGFGEQQKIQQQNQQIIFETEQYEKQRQEALIELRKELNSDNETDNLNYNLPSFSNLKGTEHYRNLFDKMLNLDAENYSIKDLNFEIENAFFENKKDKTQFDQVVKQSTDYILAKMKDSKYDLKSNTAKNYTLFQFFSETIQLKNSTRKHLPFKYDFEDYMGEKDYSKTFVTKLTEKHSGQCRSMPLFYLMLAEQIGAEAHLAFSPNHSFIKFRDENDKWYNVELTNGMFTASSFMINSGYIKAEALQNEIYLKNLSKKELLSQFYIDLANGYIHKFGYDDFVEKITEKALELYPNNVHAQMIKANYNAIKFEFVAKQLGINPRDKEQLQKIKNYPNVIALLHKVNSESQKVDNLGFTEMPAEEYQKWLNSLKQAKRKQENEAFKGEFNMKIKNNFRD
jgi:hypothetical protein